MLLALWRISQSAQWRWVVLAVVAVLGSFFSSLYYGLFSLTYVVVWAVFLTAHATSNATAAMPVGASHGYRTRCRTAGHTFCHADSDSSQTAALGTCSRRCAGGFSGATGQLFGIAADIRDAESGPSLVGLRGRCLVSRLLTDEGTFRSATRAYWWHVDTLQQTADRAVVIALTAISATQTTLSGR